MEDLIRELLRARKEKGITQAELGRHVGLPQGHISSIEQGKIDIRISTLIQIARVLDHEIMLVPRQLNSFVKAMIEGRENVETEPSWQPDNEED